MAKFGLPLSPVKKPVMSTLVMASLFFALTATGLSGCGKKGPLYLPQPAPDPATKPAVTNNTVNKTDRQTPQQDTP